MKIQFVSSAWTHWAKQFVILFLKIMLTAAEMGAKMPLGIKESKLSLIDEANYILTS